MDEKSARQVAGAAVLPREGAFVVHLGLHSTLSSGALRGRVEHVASGMAEQFDGIGELQAFVVGVLGSLPDFAGSREAIAPRGEERSHRCDTA